MLKNKLVMERIKFFLLGMLVVIGLVILMGANTTDTGSHFLLGTGRYQISSWGSFGEDKVGGFGVYIVDTLTGETKTVYTRLFGIKNEGILIKNNLRKPFNTIE